ncbi:MAG: LCP family protein [Oscillospiraceae bacterium]|jgi:LCP family protein required for cell wall assembly|nr:LCP family protein [Oscillospiraceae bacterium]
MKLFGGKSKKKKSSNVKRHNNVSGSTSNQTKNVANNNVINNRVKVSNSSRNRKALIVTFVILGVIVLGMASLYTIIRWEVQPFYDYLFKPSFDNLSNPRNPRPVVNPDDPDTPFINVPGDDEEGGWERIQEIRSTDIYTFLIMGIDGHSNTDVIMIASLDTIEQSLEVVSIPRDTLVNVSWNPKKINSIQPVMRNKFARHDNPYDTAMDATVVQLRDFLGFEVDFWVTINMTAFIRLIDDIGGVVFNVPRDMSWDDPESGHVYNLKRGEQRLDGLQSLGLMRYRATIGDIGRITTQQNFLNAAATQILANRSSVSVTSLADTFIRHVRTDIQLNHLVWFGREFLKLDPDKVNFSTMPGSIDKIGIYDLITVHVNEWLEIVNTKLSYFHDEITLTDVSILTRNSDRQLFVTDDNWQDNLNWTTRRSTSQSTAPDTITDGDGAAIIIDPVPNIVNDGDDDD